MLISARGFFNPFLCCAAALCLALLMGCTPPGPKALLAGERLIHEGKFEEAIVKLKIATELLPTNAQAWNHLGLAYHGAGQVDNAVHAYQTALSLNRNLAATRFNLGCLFLEQNNPSAAATELSSYTVFNPLSAEGWGKLGLAQLQLGQLNSADQSFKQALKLEGRFPSALNGLGLIQLRHNRPADALQYFGLALRQQTNYSPAVLNEAIVYQQYLKNRPMALQKYRDYLAINPGAANAQAVRDTVQTLETELGPAARPAVSNTSPLLATVVTQMVALPGTPSNAIRGGLTNLKASVGAPASLVATQAVPSQIEAKTEVKTNVTQTTMTTTQTARAKPVVAAAKTTPAAPVVKPAPPIKAVEKPETLAEAPKVTARIPDTLPVATPPPTPTVTVPTVEPAAIPAATQTVTVASAPLAEPQKVDTTVQAQTVPAEQTASPAPTSTVAQEKPAKKSLLQKINPVNWGRSSAKKAKTVTPLAPVNRPSTTLPAETLAISSTPATATEKGSAAAQPSSRIARYPFVSPPMPVAGDRAAAERALREGAQAHTLGHWQATVAAYRKAAQADPSYFAARYDLALALLHEKELSQALLEFETALVIDPQSFNARYNFALALQEANYPMDAANEFNKLAAIAPTDNRLHLALGNLYARQLFQPQLARKEYLKLLELEPAHPQALAIRRWLAENP